MIRLLFFSSVFAVTIFAQISPGDLSRAHQSLEGISNCTKCHELGKQLQSSKCLDCHTEIRGLINSGRGYHSSDLVKSKNCWNCHSDHHGRDYKVIRFDSKAFSHSSAKFDLVGKHAKLECEKCHNNSLIKQKLSKKSSGTYLGLNKNCVDCHTDPHQKTLGDKCISCHNNDLFKPASNFNHNNSDFKLVGAHTSVICAKCHAVENKNGKQFQKFKGIIFSSCASCHKDIHSGKFGANCLQCHTNNSFKEFKKSEFNHSKTGFQLIGAHANLDCKKCHGTSFRLKLKHDECNDCHKDYHEGEFITNGASKHCDDCHNNNSFVPSDFTFEKHNLAKFKIEGTHLAVPCKNCHMTDAKWKFINSRTECVDCHSNFHGKEIIEKYLPSAKCQSCHKISQWNEVSFDHSKTEFNLLGKHSNILCSVCHTPKGKTSKSEMVFASLVNDCLTCHNDVHYGQFREPKRNYCLRCHDFDSWKPVKFNHANAAFVLTGGHEKVSCVKCHKQVSENNSVFIKYKLGPVKCATCHS